MDKQIPIYVSHRGEFQLDQKLSLLTRNCLYTTWKYFWYDSTKNTIGIRDILDKKINYIEPFQKLFVLLEGIHISGIVQIIGREENHLGLLIVTEKIETETRKKDKHLEFYQLKYKNFNRYGVDMDTDKFDEIPSLKYESLPFVQK